MQQFHLFTVIPGDTTDPISPTSSVNYEMMHVSIVDTTPGYQDEVMRW